MSESRGQPEPSMEEILASIRRIISEESEEESDDRREPAPSAPSGAPPQSVEAKTEGAGAADSEVLLLTEMVTEDGSVVSLASGGAAPAATESPAPVAAVSPAPPPAEPRPEPVAARHLEPAPHPEPSPAPAEPARWEEPAEQQGVTETVASEMKKPGLASDQTSAAAAAAFSELTRRTSPDRGVIPGGGRMVEDLVLEALEPMLKDWLDANLAPMVERLVRQEIQRVVRQAEESI